MSSNTLGKTSSKSILYISAIIVFTNSNMLICLGRSEENMVDKNYNSDTFEHNNMFNKYDWYLKNLTFGNSTNWVWIALSKNSSILKQWNKLDSWSVEPILSKKPKRTSLTCLSLSRPKTWLAIDMTNWTSSLKILTLYGKNKPSNNWPTFKILENNWHLTSILQFLYNSIRTYSLKDSGFTGKLSGRLNILQTDFASIIQRIFEVVWLIITLSKDE